MNQSSETRARILKVASGKFAHYGYLKTSLDEIARDARIAKGTIYYHFHDKEDLFLEAIHNKAEEFFQVLESQLEAVPGFEEKLTCFLNFPVHYIFENMPILVEGMRHIPLSYQEKLEKSRQDYKERMLRLLQEIMESGKAQGIINEKIDSGRFSEIINDWFLMGDANFANFDKELLIQRIERDHELIIQLLLYGIIKRRK